MRRVAVIGCPGAGKSTFSVQLGHLLGTEVIHLDRLYWRAGWVPQPKDEWLRLQAAALTGDRWIVDGNYGATMDLRLAVADTVVFLDLPRSVCLGRAIKRVIRSRRIGRPDMADGYPERINLEFLRYIWTFRRLKRPGILRRLQGVSVGTRVVSLTSSRAAEAFLATVRRGVEVALAGR